MSAELRLVVPDTAYVASYREALVRGWTPTGEEDPDGFFLNHLAEYPESHLARSRGEDLGQITLADGSRVDWPVMVLRWIWDGEFCGTTGLMYMPETFAVPDMLPKPNHIGILLVPWKQGLGYGRQVLGLMLQEARSAGVNEVILTCDADNVPAARNIRFHGGVLLTRGVEAGYGDLLIERYRIAL